MRTFPLFKERGRFDNIEMELVRKDGSVLPLLVNATAICNEDGQFIMSRSTLMDNTAQLRAREELERINRELEQASKAKEVFVSTLSHEIRTPLNAIVLLNRLLSETTMGANQRSLVERMDVSTRNLLGLLNDILDFSKIEAGRIDLESVPFELDGLLENLASAAVGRIGDKPLELIFLTGDGVPSGLVGDPVRLGQVLENLVGNALKFTQSGEVVVAVSLVDGDAVVVQLAFSVRDTGIGMTAEQAQRVFEPFTQADASMTRRFGGTGLGLTIARSLVRLMGGELRLDSTLGVGSTFSFTLRMTRQEQQSSSKRTLCDTLRNARVLVAESSCALGEFLQSTLQHFGLEVTLVASCQAASKELASALGAGRPFDLVVAEVALLGEDAQEEAFRRCVEAGGPELPVVLLARPFVDRPDLLESAAGLPAVWLEKPLSRSKLFDAVATALGASRPLHRTEAPKNPSALPPARILLVEDNAIGRDVARALLESRGLQVDLAENGQQAVERYKESVARPYDLILMDIRMPVMDGLEATAEIRRLDPNHTVPILAMTAEAIAGTDALTANAGMDDYITKPIDPDRLFERLARWLVARSGSRPGTSHTRALTRLDPRQTAALDVVGGLTNVGGKPVLYRRILKRFMHDHATFPALLAELNERGDAKGLSAALHSIRGVSGTLGAHLVHHLLAELEETLADHAPPSSQLASELQRLTAAFAALAQEVEAFLASDAEESCCTPINPVSHEQQLEALRALATLLADDDARAVDALAALARGFRGTPGEPMLRQIEEAVGRYDYASASALVTSRIESLNLEERFPPG